MANNGERPEVGSPAPDFTLPSGPNTTFRLSDARGRPVVLVFYPADWSPVCSDQLSLYAALNYEFDAYDTTLAGISVDGVWCHAAFADARSLPFPLLADFEPKGEVSRRFGVYRNHDGFSDRALFLIDADGIVRWREVVPPEVNPGADSLLVAIEQLPDRADGGPNRATKGDDSGEFRASADSAGRRA